MGIALCVILAGGAGRRMGAVSKPLLALNNRPLLAHVIARVAPQADQVIINVSGLNDDPVAAYCIAHNLAVVPDADEVRHGPLAGVLAGLRHAQEHGLPGPILTVPADTPFLPADLAARLLTATNIPPARMAIANSDGIAHPITALWPLKAAQTIERQMAAGNASAMRVAEELGTRSVTWKKAAIAGHAVDPFFNINTPDELAAAEKLFAPANTTGENLP